MDATREPAERYRLERILRSTRAGTVMEGADLQSGRPVVVKVIHPGPPERLAAAQAGFERLVAALQALRHPAFPAVLDAGFSPDGSAFLVLERLIGRTLERAAGESVVRTVSLLAQAAAGLEALAQEGVEHGNLALDDLWVVDPRGTSRRDDEGQIKLLGLGACPFHHAATEPDVTALARAACQALHARWDADRGVVELPPLVASSLHDPEPLRRMLERALKPPPSGPPAAAELRGACLAALRRTVPAPPPPAEPAPDLAAEAAAGLAGEELFEGPEVLSEVTDELLHAPPPPPPPPPATVAVVAAAPEPAPPPRRRRPLLWLGAAAAAVAVAALAVTAFLATRSPEPAPAPVPVAPAPPPAEPVRVRLDRAIGFMAAGEDARAREILAALTVADQAALGREGCSRLALAQQMLRLAARDGLAHDLPVALEQGSLATAVALVRAAAAEGVAPAGLYAGAEQDYERARQLADVFARAEQATAAGTPLRVLEVYRELAALFPDQRDGFELRQRAAAALAEQARDRARAGDYAGALSRLADLQRLWPDAPGLREEIATVIAQRDAEPVQQALLDRLAGFERRRRPDEALAELARHEPTPHLAPAFAAERQRFTAQLATLDGAPPVVELREGYGLQYARGTVAELSFRVRDDYGVEQVRVMARRAGGGAMREIPSQRGSFGYTVEIGPDFHGNGTVELYVVATDVSGHEGTLGTPERPLRLERIKGFGERAGN